MFCPPASTPPIVASGDACSLIIAMLTVTVARSCLLLGSSMMEGQAAEARPAEKQKKARKLLQSACRSS